MWEEADISKYQLVVCGWFNVMVLNEEAIADPIWRVGY